jgi:hypothetical protein
LVVNNKDAGHWIISARSCGSLPRNSPLSMECRSYYSVRW